MFLNKLFHFLKGYVILYLTGFNIERFLYICARRGIELRRIRRGEEPGVYITVGLGDFLKLRPIAYKTRTKVHIKKKAGLPIFLKKYKKRYFLYLGAVFAAAALLITSQFIWSVELVGVKNADTVKINRALKEAGIYVGAFKPSAKTGKEVKNIILSRVDNVSWAWVYLKGTRAVCEIYEGRVPREAFETGEECNICAARDGVIKRIIATDGARRVSAGDTVVAGEVLISGELFAPNGEVGANVAADGIVEARTWHEKTDTYKLYEEYREKTGNVRRLYTLKLFSKSFGLCRSEEIPYKDCDIKKTEHELRLFGSFYTGAAIVSKTAEEVRTVRFPISCDMAVYAGRCDLEARIAKELLPGAELTDEELHYTMVDPETVEVTLTMEFIENIGMKVPIE